MPAALLIALALAGPAPQPVIEDVHQRFSRAIVSADQAAMDQQERDRFRPDCVFAKSDGRCLDYWTAFEGSRSGSESRRAGREDGPIPFDATQ